MTADDFNTFMDGHCQRFPGVRSWIASETEKMRKAAASQGKDPSGINIWGHWYHALKDLDWQACDVVSAEMFNGELDKPNGYSEHPAFIRRNVKSRMVDRFQNVYRDGERTYKCQLCEDEGVVSVVDPRKTPPLSELTSNLQIGHCAAACRCESGARYIELRFPKYDSDRMCMWEFSDVMVDDFKRFVAERQLSKRHPAFDDWNREQDETESPF